MSFSSCLNKKHVENAVLRVADEIERSEEIGRNWKKYAEDELWFELVACILGSRVKYETAKECLNHLENRGLLRRDFIVNNPRTAWWKISSELRKPVYSPFSNGNGSRYPYSKTKSKFVVRTCIEIYKKKSTSIRLLLTNCKSAYEARDSLINTCSGVGPKQGSLFLRNIGYGDGLAILDSHVIRYMKIFGLLEGHGKMTTRNQYVTNERNFLCYANSLNKNVAHLDLAVWIVMRVAQKGI